MIIKLGCIKCSKENDISSPDAKHVDPRRRYERISDDMIESKFKCWYCKETNDICWYPLDNK